MVTHSFFNVDILLFYIKQLDNFQKMTLIFWVIQVELKLSAVRKVPETKLFQALGSFETLGSIISHGTSTKFADVPTHLRKVFLEDFIFNLKGMVTHSLLVYSVRIYWWFHTLLACAVPLSFYDFHTRPRGISRSLYRSNKPEWPQPSQSHHRCYWIRARGPWW